MNNPRPAAATVSQRIAAYVEAARFEQFEPAVVQKAKEVMLYDIALALQCARDEQRLGMQALRLVGRLSPHGGPATIIGTRARAMPIDAAFANCSQMRAYGLDDVIFPAGIHAGLMTIPAALALAEQHGRSGRDVLAAVILGYEVMGKLGTFSWDSESPRRPTMPYGTFGAVIASGRILGLTREQFAHAVGYAVHAAQGVGEGTDAYAAPDHYYSLVTRAGMTGAMIAQEGGMASATVMEGRFGFFETFTGQQSFDADKFFASLGRDYQIVSWVEKRYPGTGLNIIGIELLREIVTKQHLRCDDVREVRFLVPEERRNFTGGHRAGPFNSADEAAGTAAYHMAMLLVDGKLDFSRYGQFDSPPMRAAVAKIKPLLMPGKANIRWTRIEVELANGRTIATEGESYTFPPIPPHERLASAAADLLSPAQIEHCHEQLMSLDKQPSIAALMASLVPEA